MSTLTKRGPLNSPTNLIGDARMSSAWLSSFIRAFKQSRFTQILTALLAIQLLFAMLLGVQSSKQGNFASGEPLLSVAADDITKIEISDLDDSVTLLKQSNEWQIDGDSKLPVQTSKLESVLDTITTLKTGLPVANSEAAREQLKVAKDDFVRRVSISGDKMESTTLMLGTSPGLRKSHLRREGTHEIYSASLPVSDLPSKANDWFDKSLLSFSDIISVRSNDMRFSLIGEDDKKEWTVSKPSDENRNIDTAKLEAVLTALQGMRVNSIAEIDLKTDSSETTEIVEIHVASDKPETKLTMEKHGDVITVKRDDVSGIFTLTETQFEQFSALAALDDFLTDSKDAEPIDETTEPVKESADN